MPSVRYTLGSVIVFVLVLVLGNFAFVLVLENVPRHVLRRRRREFSGWKYYGKSAISRATSSYRFTQFRIRP